MLATSNLKQLQIRSYEWDVTNNELNNIPGKAIPNQFSFDTNLSAASPDVFAAVATGTIVPEIELASFDTQGRKITSWKLTNAKFTSYQPSANLGEPPIDSFQVTFDAIDATYTQFSPDGTPTSATTHWNYANSQGTLSPILHGQNPNRAGNLVLGLDKGIELAIRDFNWNELTSSSGKVQLGSFTISTDLNTTSIDLLSRVNSGKPLDTVEIFNTDASGKLVDSWTLQNVGVTSNGVTAGNEPGAAQDFFTLNPTKVTHNFFTGNGNVISDSWDSQTNRGTAFNGFNGLQPLPASGDILTLGDGKQLNISSFNWGVNNSNGKAQAGQFEFSASLSAASPDFLAAVAAGVTLPQIELDRFNDRGQIASWKLTNAKFSNYQIGGTQGGIVDDFQVSFDGLDATTFANGVPIATHWDYAKNQGDNSPLLHGQNLQGKAFPVLSFGTGADVAVQNFSWNETNAGGIQFGEFNFNADANAASIDLLSFVNTGKILPQVTFYDTDAQGKLVDRWDLENVTVTSNQISGEGFAETNQFALKATKVTSTVMDANGNPISRSWDTQTNTGTPFGNFNQVTKLTQHSGSRDVLQLGSSHELRINAYDWSVSNTGKSQAGQFEFSADLGVASPDLLAAVATGSHIGELILDSFDSTGHKVMSWKLTDAAVTSYQTTGSLGTTPIDLFQVSFQGIDIAKYSNYLSNGRPGQTVSTHWDYAKDRGAPVSAIVHGQDLHTAPGFILSFGRGADLAIKNFRWNETNSGKVSFGAFTFTSDLSAASVDLVALVNSGKHLPKVTLFERDAMGKLMSQWDLEDAIVTSNQVQGSQTNSIMNDVFNLSASKVTNTVINANGESISRTWDLKTDMGTPFGGFSGLPANTLNSGTVLTLGGANPIQNASAGATQLDLTAGLQTTQSQNGNLVSVNSQSALMKAVLST